MVVCVSFHWGGIVTTPDSSAHVPQVGERFHGTVVKTAIFGAFVELTPGTQGLLHVTQIRKLYGGRASFILGQNPSRTAC